MEAVSRAIPQSLEDTKVTRNGTVDWHYKSYEEDYVSDDQIYDSNGDIISPLDEFLMLLLAVYFVAMMTHLSPQETSVPMYIPTTAVCESTSSLILSLAFFNWNEFEDGTPMPLPSSLKAHTSSVRIGPVSILKDDGSVVEDDVVMGFFPGEATSYYVRHYRERVQDEIGFEHVIAGGYAQDHEGYLLIPEDWLLGGYETNINIWGFYKVSIL